MSTVTISQSMPSTCARKAVIIAQWVGEGLAVHGEVFINQDGSVQPISNLNKWALTCVNTGRVAGFFNGDLQKAILLAQEWDKDFAEVGEDVPQRLRSDFQVAMYLAENSEQLSEQEVAKLSFPVAPVEDDRCDKFLGKPIDQELT